MDNPKPLSTITVTDIKTELGNRVLTGLVRAGWVVEYAYPDNTIDKGIDFDAYTIAKDGERLEFEWTNWDEWQMRGSSAIVQAICADFGIAAHPVDLTTGPDSATRQVDHLRADRS